MKLYVVELSRWSTGDIGGLSCDAERIWFQHVSSSPTWLRQDTTFGFGDRQAALEAAGYMKDETEIVYVERGSDLPAEISHHFTKVSA